jgi:hypothetical protein
MGTVRRWCRSPAEFWRMYGVAEGTYSSHPCPRCEIMLFCISRIVAEEGFEKPKREGQRVWQQSRLRLRPAYAEVGEEAPENRLVL